MLLLHQLRRLLLVGLLTVRLALSSEKHRFHQPPAKPRCPHHVRKLMISVLTGTELYLYFATIASLWREAPKSRQKIATSIMQDLEELKREPSIVQLMSMQMQMSHEMHKQKLELLEVAQRRDDVRREESERQREAYERRRAQEREEERETNRREQIAREERFEKLLVALLSKK
jgi:hypothetical protein